MNSKVGSSAGALGFVQGSDELLLSSGCYRYYQNDQLLSISEPWARYTNDQGLIITRVERVAPEYGMKMAVQSLECEGLIKKFQVQYETQSSHQSSVILADYDIAEGVYSASRSVNGLASQHYRQQLEEAFFASPLMRVYVGPTLKWIESQGGSALVLMPWIHDPGNEQRMLEPRLGERRVQLTEKAELVEMKGLRQHCDCYEYTGDQYQAGSRFWIDDQGLLQRYCWQQNDGSHWDVQLDALELTDKPHW